jgi:predicted transcriptional regulator
MSLNSTEPSTNYFVQAGKKKTRGELRLPNTYFIMADDWMEKLGYEVFCVWLKLYTFVDRKNDYIETDGGHIPYSFESTYNKLNISESKFYRIIKLLWEYGLIDIVVYEKSQRKTNKPRNIIVYDYPQNNVELATKPLEKCRDWKKDYKSNYKTFGMKGGRPKKEKEPLPEEDKKDNSNPFKTKRVDPFKIKRVTLLKLKANNVSNNLFNVSNKSTNVSNKNLSIINEIEKLELHPKIVKVLDRQIDRLNSDYIPAIELKFNSYQESVGVDKFADILNTVLSQEIKSNFANYLDRSLNTYLDNRSKFAAVNNDNKPIREEKIPSYLEEEEKEPEPIDYTDEDTINQLIKFAQYGNIYAKEQLKELNIDWEDK